MNKIIPFLVLLLPVFCWGQNRIGSASFGLGQLSIDWTDISNTPRQLPIGCLNGHVALFNGSTWTCLDTTGFYSSGGGGTIQDLTLASDLLSLTGSSVDINLDAYLTSKGVLTSYTETDPVFLASDVVNFTTLDSTNWTTAFGWGDHSLAGYLTSFTETQDLSLSTNDLSITGGSTIDLSPYLDNTNLIESEVEAFIQGNETSFDNWDKDVTDDFSGDYNDLTNQPTTITTIQATLIADGLQWADTSQVGGVGLATYADLQSVLAGAADGAVTSGSINGTNIRLLQSNPGTSPIDINITSLTTDVEAAATYEPLFNKNTGFNKNFGTTSGTVLEGNADLTADNLGDNDTDDLPEGATNKYADPVDELQTLSWDNTNNNISITSGNTLMVTGFADSALVSNLNLNLDDLSDNTTSDLAEGTNLYYTEARVSANPAVTLNTAKLTYPNADSVKLAGIEAGATGDLTGAEIKVLYEGEANTNAFTDALNTTLGFITATQAINLDDVTDSLSVYTDSITNHHLRLIDVENTVAGSSHNAVTLAAGSNPALVLNGQQLKLNTLADADSSTTNELQDLTLIGDFLNTTPSGGGAAVDLSGYDDSGLTLSQVITNGASAGGKITNLTLATNGTDAANLTNVTNAITASEASDGDMSATNEIQTLLDVVNESGATPSVGSNRDIIGITNSPAFSSSIASRGYVEQSIITSDNADLDKDNTNEIQNLSINDATGAISIDGTGGNTIQLAGSTQFFETGEGTLTYSSTSGTNFDSYGRWQRVGTIVTMTGFIELANPINGVYIISITPPIASDFTVTTDVTGNGNNIYLTQNADHYTEIDADFSADVIRIETEGHNQSVNEKIQFVIQYTVK